MSPCILLINLPLGPIYPKPHLDFFFLAITAISFIKADAVKKQKEERQAFC